jgi:hypothetical protein
MQWFTLLFGKFSTAQVVPGQYIPETYYPTRESSSRPFCLLLVSSFTKNHIANATGSGGWSAAFNKATAFVAQMNLTEKAFMVTGVNGPCVGNIPGIPRLGFKGLCLQDGPLAIRQVSYASVFPAGVSVAATFDAGLMYQRGVALGQEFVAKGANIMLGYAQFLTCFF